MNSIEQLARRGVLATFSGTEELAKRVVRRAGSATAR
jgi:hypothetical protein